MAPKDSPVKKTYQLHIEGKNRDRLIDASKHDIRKYAKRERSRPLPKGVDYWDFDCKFGNDEASAEPVHFATLMGLITAATEAGATQFYVEVLTKHGVRTARPQQSADGYDDEDFV